MDPLAASRPAFQPAPPPASSTAPPPVSGAGSQATDGPPSGRQPVAASALHARSRLLSPRRATARTPSTTPPAPVASLEAPRAAAPADPLALAGLDRCVEEALRVARRHGRGPREPAGFSALLARLEAAGAALPPSYRRGVVEPLLRTLRELGPAEYARLLAADPRREGPAALILDVSQAVLQRGEGHPTHAARALQELVSDLYDGFLSSGARRGVAPPDGARLAPLVRWGSAEAGPYTWPAADVAAMEVKAPVVSFPAPGAAGGLLAWALVAHEAAGHDVLSAFPGLREQVARAVERAFAAERLPAELGRYFAERIEEVASDVLGVLSMGPAAAAGLIGWARAVNAAAAGEAALGTVGLKAAPHPASLLRAYVAAETVRRLSFDGAAGWADRLLAEAEEDLRPIRLAGRPVANAMARAAAAAVARAIATSRLPALGGRSLVQLQDWEDRDEAVVARLRRRLITPGGGLAPGSSSPRDLAGAHAPHAVAAAVYQAVSGAADPASTFSRLVDLLAEMHGRNPTWRAAGAPGR